MSFFTAPCFFCIKIVIKHRKQMFCGVLWWCRKFVLKIVQGVQNNCGKLLDFDGKKDAVLCDLNDVVNFVVLIWFLLV